MKIASNRSVDAQTRKLMTKGLLSTGITLAFAFVVLAFAASYAWFAMNREVGSNGMRVSADVSSNLVIAKTNPGTGENVISTMTASSPDPFSVAFADTDGREKMLPATHDSDVTATLLKYVKNAGDVGITTGVAKDGKTLTFENVPAATNSLYYVDFSVDIASIQKELENHDLIASIVPQTVTVDAHYAVTVDFYLGSVSSTNYKGSINIEDSLGSPAKTLKIVEGSTIPLNTSGHLTVIMRCYFDGALAKKIPSSDGTTYVKTSTVTTDTLNFGVVFDAVEA